MPSTSLILDNNHQPEGIIDPANAKVADIMTTDLLTATPDTTMSQALEIVTNKRIWHLPVLQGGNLMDLISIGDLTKWMMESQEQHIESLTNDIS